MLARERKPEELVITNLRIRESLRRALEREAEQHQVSLNKEIINRLEDSLEAGDKLELRAIRADMETIWMRYSEWFSAHELEEGILTALEQRDFSNSPIAAPSRCARPRRQRRADGQPRWRGPGRKRIRLKCDRSKAGLRHCAGPLSL